MHYVYMFLMVLQSQYIVLEKKYSKAKKLLREFQQREQDLLHREEFYLQLLQEKDTEYNALVKTLKDRVSYCYSDVWQCDAEFVCCVRTTYINLCMVHNSQCPSIMLCISGTNNHTRKV
jgi:hypothetical protein